MTKQQIVVQLVAAKIVHSGVIPHKDFLEQCVVAADKIIEMFPEPEYSVNTNIVNCTLDAETLAQTITNQNKVNIRA